MRRLLTFFKGLIGLCLIIVAVIFSLNNHQLITVDLSPSPFVLDIPLYLLILLVLAVGIVLGAMTRWRRKNKKTV